MLSTAFLMQLVLLSCALGFVFDSDNEKTLGFQSLKSMFCVKRVDTQPYLSFREHYTTTVYNVKETHSNPLKPTHPTHPTQTHSKKIY
jgi:hypothetical protein